MIEELKKIASSKANYPSHRKIVSDNELTITVIHNLLRFIEDSNISDSRTGPRQNRLIQGGQGNEEKIVDDILQEIEHSLAQHNE